MEWEKKLRIEDYMSDDKNKTEKKYFLNKFKYKKEKFDVDRNDKKYYYLDNIKFEGE